MVYHLFRFLGSVCPRLPPRFGYWLFARIGDLGFILTSKKQQTYLSNLRRVLGDQATPARLNSIARRGYQNLLKNYFDLFRAHGLTKEYLRTQLAGVQGLEYIENAMKQCKGVIAGSGHFGAWDMVIHLTAVYLNTRIVTPQEHLKPEKLFQYVLHLRRSQGMDLVAVESAPREMIKALRAGRIVGMAFDRDITGSGQVVDFFGAHARLPDGAVQLAFKYGCPVIIGFSVRQPDNRSFLYIEPPIEFEKTVDLVDDIRTGVQKIAHLMEHYIRQYPDQWLMFQKIWE